jgi:hypothetical protein
VAEPSVAIVWLLTTDYNVELDAADHGVEVRKQNPFPHGPVQ